MQLEQALEHVFAEEGGWSDHPDDPGGKTNMGITLRTLKRAVRQDIIADLGTEETWKDRLKTLTRAEATEIYRVLYWEAAACDQLPDGLDLLAFDAAVNQGVSRSIKFYQKAAGTKADGIWGPNTRRAIEVTATNRLILDMSVYRALHYSSLGKLAVFGKGWFRRLFRTFELAKRNMK